MSTENFLWGAPRVHGELLKLGFSVAQSSVAKYIEQGCACLSPGSANRRHNFARHTGRTSSSIRSDLDFRYTQVQDRPPACQNANAADGDRGALSPSPHHQARARPQDLSLPAAPYGDPAPDPALG